MPVSDSAARILSALLEARTGQQLTSGRRWRLETALQPLLREQGFASLDELAAALAGGGAEPLARAVVEALLNNETFFYRDRQLFDLLLGPALDRLAQARASQRRIAIWCAGGSTGQEAYSLAMHFAERSARWAGWRIDILATDVSEGAVAQAASGFYSQFEVQRGLGVLQMMRWFEERPGSRWQISEPLRRAVRFEAHNLLGAPPAGAPFDILLCRNVLLYFSPATARSACARLAEAAAADSVLMLGAGETLIGQGGAFLPDPDCRGLYRRSGAPAAARYVAAS